MEFRKRDGIGAILLCFLLRLIMSRSSSSNISISSSTISMSLSFYTEYSASHNPCNETSHTEPCWIEVARPLPFDCFGNGLDCLIVPSVRDLRILDLTKSEPEGRSERYDSLPYNPPSILRLGRTMLGGDGEDWNSDAVPVQIAAKSRDDGVERSRSVRVCTVWSDGSVTLHNTTLENPRTDTATARNPQQEKKEALGYLWKKHLFPEMDLTEMDATFHPDGRSVILFGRSTESLEMSYYSLNVEDGKVIWKHDGAPAMHSDKKNSEVEGGVVSSIGQSDLLLQRRGGRALHLTPSMNMVPSVKEEHGKDCLQYFRHSIMDGETGAFPHAYWGTSNDAKINFASFRHEHHTHTKGNTSPTKNNMDQSKDARKLKVFTHSIPVSSKTKNTNANANPNVIISHGSSGIEVLSLKNGHPICHLSLLDHGFYADINHDGTIEYIRVPVDQPPLPFQSAFAKEWLKKMNIREEDTHDHNCQITIQSGLPAREEVLSFSLCPPEQGSLASQFPPIHTAPPLIIEGGSVIVSTNVGLVIKFNSRGDVMWHNRPHRKKAAHSVSTWDNTPHGKASAFVGLIQLTDRPSTDNSNPILIAGQDKMLLLDPTNGRTIQTVSFPQSSISRPILADMVNAGDGVTDVLIMSVDAIWGYKVEIKSGMLGASDLLSMLAWIFVMGIFVSLVVASFGDGKRSTDL